MINLTDELNDCRKIIVLANWQIKHCSSNSESVTFWTKALVSEQRKLKRIETRMKKQCSSYFELSR